MANVFLEKDGTEVLVRLSNGRMELLKYLVENYERLLKWESSQKATTSKPKPGEWFLIDRDVIDKNMDEIYRKCKEAGDRGKYLWQKFEDANAEIHRYPGKYPRLIETFIFEHNWDYKTEKEMRDMCKAIGKGMCNGTICYLELQMRICNGESVNDLLESDDNLPCVRVVEIYYDGSSTGFFGGGIGDDDGTSKNHSPADLTTHDYRASKKYYYCTPYAYREVTLQD